MQRLEALERAIAMFTAIETSIVSSDRVLMLSLLGDIVADSDKIRIREGLLLRPVTLKTAGLMLKANAS